MFLDLMWWSYGFYFLIHLIEIGCVLPETVDVSFPIPSLQYSYPFIIFFIQRFEKIWEHSY